MSYQIQQWCIEQHAITLSTIKNMMKKYMIKYNI